MKGVTVVLHVRTQTGVDALNDPVFSETVVNVDNVLVGEPTTDEIADSVSRYGKKLDYVLGLPKGDSHVWTDTVVEIFGERFATFGDTIRGIEENIPTPWHRKVRVTRCE